MVDVQERRQQELEEQMKEGVPVGEGDRVRVPESFIVGGGSSRGEVIVARSAASARAEEVKRIKVIEDEKRRKIEEAKTEQERIRDTERQKLIDDIARRREGSGRDDLIVGLVSTTRGFEFREGKSVPTEKPTVIKNVGESQQAFETRAERLGKGISQSKPEETEKFLERVKLQEAIETPRERIKERFEGRERPQTDTEIIENISSIGRETSIGVFEPLTFREQVSQKVLGFKDTFRDLQKFEKEVGETTAKPLTKPLRDAVGFAGKIPLFPGEPKQIRELRTGFSLGVIEDIERAPLKQLALVGAGTILGGGIKVIGAGGKAVTTLIGGGRTTGLRAGTAKVIERTLSASGTTLALGVGGLAVVDVSGRIRGAGSVGDVGKELGIFTKDVGLIGVGAVAGTKGVDKFVGGLRTRGLAELPAKDIIAPEFFRGQTFPIIRRGQRAGELRAEFFEPALPGEVGRVGRGFTASPQTFATETTLQRGTSEVPGLFTAPRVSPRFLRIEAEAPIRLFGFDVADIGKPTIIRITPKSIELAPGVTARTKDLAKIDKQFFEDIAGTGRGIIPFAKTEKEAVIAFDTLVSQTAERFFIKFQGVKVPIKEFATTPKGKTPLSAKSLSDVVKSSSRSRLKSSALITPSRFSLAGLSSRPSGVSRKSILSSSSISSKSVSKISSIPSSIISTPSSSILPSISKVSSLSSIRNLTRLSIIPTSPPRPLPRRKRTPPIIPLIPSSRRIKKVKKKQPVRSWNVKAKQLKQKKYTKINKVPLSRLHAQSLGSFLTDTSLGASFKISGSPKKPQKPKTRFPRTYFARPKIRKKFRGHKRVRGKRVALDNKWIEISKFRIDTPQEKQKIKLAKRLKQLRKPKTKQVKRRKKKK